jgi:hypothetical protein
MLRTIKLFVAVLPPLAAGCVVVDESREDELPTGVTLLETEQGACSGALEFEGDSDVIFEVGEGGTFRVEDDDIEWRCLSDSSRSSGETECPDDTSYVRITRDEDDAEFTLECYGA